METIKQLAPNQFYFINENKIVFQSYKTIVCIIENFENGNEPIIKITENQPQSEQPTDIRCFFVDYIDNLHRDGQITEIQAQNITL